MFHGLNNDFLYSAYRLECTFRNADGSSRACAGTGFWIANADSIATLVTNRHVLDISFRNAEFEGYTLQKLIVRGKSKEQSTKLPDVQQALEIIEPNFRYSCNPENDVACLINPNVKILSGNVEALVDYPIPRDFLATREDFESMFSVCDFVAFPGYPDWYDKRQQRPVLRTGALASDPRYDYSFSDKYEGELIAYEAFSTGGNSGSPVFAVEKGPKPGAGLEFPGYRELKMIGINASHLKTKSGTHLGERPTCTSQAQS